MYELNFMATHPIIAQTFQSKKQKSNSWWHKRKNQGSPKLASSSGDHECQYAALVLPPGQDSTAATDSSSHAHSLSSTCPLGLSAEMPPAKNTEENSYWLLAHQIDLNTFIISRSFISAAVMIQHKYELIHLYLTINNIHIASTQLSL